MLTVVDSNLHLYYIHSCITAYNFASHVWRDICKYSRGYRNVSFDGEKLLILYTSLSFAFVFSIFFSPSVVLILNRKKQVYEQFTKSGTARTPRQSGTSVTKKERSRLRVLTIHLNNLSIPPLTACSTCFSFKRKNIRLYTPPSKWSHWRYRDGYLGIPGENNHKQVDGDLMLRSCACNRFIKRGSLFYSRFSTLHGREINQLFHWF